MFGEFVDFEWDQRARRYDGEILGPMLAQQQSDTFSQQQGRIKKGASAQLLELCRCYTKNFSDHVMNEAVVRINSQNIHRMRDGIGNVLMQQFESTNPDDDKQESFSQLEQADKYQSWRAGIARVARCFEPSQRVRIPDRQKIGRFLGIRQQRNRSAYVNKCLSRPSRQGSSRSFPACGSGGCREALFVDPYNARGNWLANARRRNVYALAGNYLRTGISSELSMVHGIDRRDCIQERFWEAEADLLAISELAFGSANNKPDNSNRYGCAAAIMAGCQPDIGERRALTRPIWARR